MLSKLRPLKSNYTLVTDKINQLVIILAITLVSFGVKLINLSSPFRPHFDEVYYVQNVLTMLKKGVEFNASKNTFTGDTILAVHPPLGKWLLATGVLFFGDNSFGWRIGAVVLGSLSVLLVGLIAKELFNNYIITALSTFFMAIEPIAFTNSRTAILEAPLTFMVLLTTLVFIKGLKTPRYLYLFGLLMGLTLGVKWNALYNFIGYILIYLIYMYPKILYYLKNKKIKKLITWALKIKIQFIILPVLAYLSTWWGWFIAKEAQFRFWAEANPETSFNLVPSALRSLWHLHADIYRFHGSLERYHISTSHPYQWFLGTKPTLIFKVGTFDSDKKENYGGLIANLPNPFISIGILVATVITIRMLSKKLDFSLLIPLVLILTAYLPWFAYSHRTTFAYYVDTFLPFMLILLAYSLYLLYLKATSRKYKLYWVIFAVALPLAFFFYFYPLYIGQIHTFTYLNSHLWLSSWFRF